MIHTETSITVMLKAIEAIANLMITGVNVLLEEVCSFLAMYNEIFKTFATKIHINHSYIYF